MASHLGVPHASVAAKVVLEDGKVKVHRELEGGIQEVLALPTPALLTVQFGINEPRYASVAAILKATRQPIQEVFPADLGLPEASLGGRLSVRRMYVPEATHQAEMMEGEPQDMAKQLADVLKGKGFGRGG